MKFLRSFTGIQPASSFPEVERDLSSREPTGEGTRVSYYGFNLLGAVRGAASSLPGESTYCEVCRLVKEEHPEFDVGDSEVVSNCLNVLVKQGRVRRVKGPNRRDRTPSVFRNAGDAD